MAVPMKLLVTTDLSARSDRAVERAVRLAGETGSSLTVLHVVDADLPQRLANRQAEDARQSIAEHLGGLPNAGQVEVKTEILLGKDNEEIIAFAEAKDVDLVIVGVHRNASQAPLFVGTTAERVIRHGPKPVLVVKDRVAAPYRRVMIAVDFSIHSRRAIEFALRLLPDAEFHLVHAYDVPFKGFLNSREVRRELYEQHETQMRSLVDGEFKALWAALENKPPRCSSVIKQGAVRQVVFEQIDELKPDLLVMGTHGRTGMAHALLGSVAQELLGSPPCDVMAVKAW